MLRLVLVLLLVSTAHSLNLQRLMGNVQTTVYRVGAKLLYGTGCPTNGKAILTAENYAADTDKAFDHTLWNDILQECVASGNRIRDIPLHTFDYQKLVSDKELNEKFESYLEKLATANLESLHLNHQLALLMNAYNALCINLIVQHMKSHSNSPPKSILDLKDGSTAVWDVPCGRLCGDNKMTLSILEHKWLRAVWSDARLHACIVCASVSCPDLREEAYRGDDSLDDQMTDQMRQWMANDKKGLAFSTDDSVYVSQIFNWFHDDFKPNVREFLEPYLQSEKDRLRWNAKPNRQYFEYDWGINMPE